LSECLSHPRRTAWAVRRSTAFVDQDGEVLLYGPRVALFGSSPRENGSTTERRWQVSHIRIYQSRIWPDQCYQGSSYQGIKELVK
jgi:hypothetical protein